MTGEVCPLCRGRRRTGTDRCTECQGDLRLTLVLSDLANWYFNLAVVAARSRQWRKAAEHLVVTLALAPDDVGALVLLGKVRCRQHRQAQALQLWNRARELAPDRADIAQAIESLTPAATGGRPKPRPPRRPRRRPVRQPKK